MTHLDLAYAAGKQRQSSRTNLVHSPNMETISLYDNFCFAYALLSQKKAETVLESKSILLRLLAFQSPEGNFPVHLHDFPRCFDLHNGLKIAPLLLRSLTPLLGAECREKITAALSRIFQFYEQQTLSPTWDFRYQVLRGLKPIPPQPEDIWEHWISLQFLQTPTCDFYHRGLSLALHASAPQDGFEPSPTLIEWACAAAASHFPPRLAKEHPAQLHLAALDKVELLTNQTERHLLIEPFTLYWQDEHLHSLTLVADHPTIHDNAIHIELPPTFEFGRDDLFEAAFFCDANTTFLIDGKPGTSFGLHQTIELKTPNFRCTLRFELLRGTGDFCGRIFRSNRPGQIGAPQYEAFDWKIGLRTLRRSPDCVLKVSSDYKWGDSQSYTEKEDELHRGI